MKTIAFATSMALAGLSTAALAAQEQYNLDPSHSQVVFTYEHLGFSTTYNVFTGFEGEIMFDQKSRRIPAYRCRSRSCRCIPDGKSGLSIS